MKSARGWSTRELATRDMHTAKGVDIKLDIQDVDIKLDIQDVDIKLDVQDVDIKLYLGACFCQDDSCSTRVKLWTEKERINESPLGIYKFYGMLM